MAIDDSLMFSLKTSVCVGGMQVSSLERRCRTKAQRQVDGGPQVKDSPKTRAPPMSVPPFAVFHQNWPTPLL